MKILWLYQMEQLTPEKFRSNPIINKVKTWPEEIEIYD